MRNQAKARTKARVGPKKALEDFDDLPLEHARDYILDMLDNSTFLTSRARLASKEAGRPTIALVLPVVHKSQRDWQETFRIPPAAYEGADVPWAPPGSAQDMWSMFRVAGYRAGPIVRLDHLSNSVDDDDFYDELEAAVSGAMRQRPDLKLIVLFIHNTGRAEASFVDLDPSERAMAAPLLNDADGDKGCTGIS